MPCVDPSPILCAAGSWSAVAVAATAAAATVASATPATAANVGRAEGTGFARSEQGQRVATLVDRVMETGFKQVGWNGKSASGSPVSSGVYFYRLQAGNKTLTKKMVLLR